MMKIVLSNNLAISFEMADEMAREAVAAVMEVWGREKEAAAIGDLEAELKAGEVVWTVQKRWVVRVSVQVARDGGYWTAEVTVGPHGTEDKRRIRVSWSERMEVPAAAAMIWVCAGVVSEKMGCKDFLTWLLEVGLPQLGTSANATKFMARQEARGLIQEVLALVAQK